MVDDELNKSINKALIDTAEVYEELGALKERQKQKEGKGMDWIAVTKGSMFITLFLIIGISMGLLFGMGVRQPDIGDFAVKSVQDLNSSIQQLRQGQGVLFQGEIELAKGIADINAKVSLNEQALQSLDWLSKNCTRTDENGYFNLRCSK